MFLYAENETESQWKLHLVVPCSFDVPFQPRKYGSENLQNVHYVRVFYFKRTSTLFLFFLTLIANSEKWSQNFSNPTDRNFYQNLVSNFSYVYVVSFFIPRHSFSVHWGLYWIMVLWFWRTCTTLHKIPTSFLVDFC